MKVNSANIHFLSSHLCGRCKIHHLKLALANEMPMKVMGCADPKSSLFEASGALILTMGRMCPNSPLAS